MTELTTGNLFDKALDATSAGMKLTGFGSAEPWVKLMPKLRKTVGDTFEATGHTALDDLRKALKAASTRKLDEGAFLAAGAGIAKVTGNGSGTLASAAEVSRSAALKMLRHTYYHARRGNHKMWIVSLPESYNQWPHNFLKGKTEDLITKLGATTEHFSATDRSHMADATQAGLRWVHKALLALDDLGAKGKGMKLLKRWFADEDTTDKQLTTFADTLRAGLKKIAPKMSEGTLIVTDFVPIRTSASDSGVLTSNAFVTVDKRDVIYIEKGFFTKDASAVFQKDARHWARIMVHEMTHREAKTADKRYGWAGIKPKKGTFPSADAMVNADSWALFVADAAGAMNKTDLSRALNGTAT